MLVLQLKFFHPELISPFNEKQDELEIIWLGGEEYFKAESDGARLDERSMILKRNLIKQDIDLLAVPSDTGGLPDFSSTYNNFRYFFILAAFLFVVTFR